MESRIRIECPDGTIESTRVFAGDTEITNQIQAVSWSVDVETRYAVAEIRFVLPATSVMASQEKPEWKWDR